MNEIQGKVKAYINTEFIDDLGAEPITAETPLLSSGIIDSISALELVEFIEQTFNIKFQAHEVDQDNLDNLERIETFIKGKMVPA